LESGALAPGNHTAKVTVAGTRNAASTGTTVTVDRAVVSIPPPTTVNNSVTGTTSNTFEYAGTWAISAGAGRYLGDDHYSSTAGSNYTFRFSGPRVLLFGAKAPHHGKATAQIDGGAVTTIDQYAPTRQDNALVYESSVLGAGAHVVKVTVAGTRNRASSGNTIAIDRAVLTPPPPMTTVNDSATGSTRNSFEYTGTWQTATGGSRYQRDDHYSSTTGSSYTFRFSGTRAVLYGAKASHHGKATIQIDGGAPATVDQYAATRQDNVFIYQTPVLSTGDHVINVTVSGTRNPASTGTTISIDRAVVTAPPILTANDSDLGAP
jgi:hypothetical protein